MAVDRRLVWLGGVAAAVAVAAIVASWDGETPPAAAPARPAAANRNAASADTAPPADVKLPALKRERVEPQEQGRNPFRFRPVQVIAPAPPPAPARAVGPTGDTAPAPPPVPVGPPPPPPITLKFIGVLETSAGARIAVLSDGKRPISGKEGEEIEGRYKILKIGTESLEIAYLDGRGRRTIPLTGQ